MIPQKIFESAALKKVNSANLLPGKIYLEIEIPGKNHNQGTSWIFTSIPPDPCTYKKLNSPMQLLPYKTGYEKTISLCTVVLKELVS